jgi:hypothetical protein
VPVYGKTAEEVDAKLTALKNRSNQGLPAEVGGWTVSAYAEHWLRHVATPKLREGCHPREVDLTGPGAALAAVHPTAGAGPVGGERRQVVDPSGSVHSGDAAPIRQ